MAWDKCTASSFDCSRRKLLFKKNKTKQRLYFDAALQAVELWGKRHASDQQGSSHVGESHHKLLGLSLYLNGQLPGGGQDQSHRAAHTVCWFLKAEAMLHTACHQESICEFLNVKLFVSFWEYIYSIWLFYLQRSLAATEQLFCQILESSVFLRGSSGGQMLDTKADSVQIYIFRSGLWCYLSRL